MPAEADQCIYTEFNGLNSSFTEQYTTIDTNCDAIRKAVTSGGRAPKYNSACCNAVSKRLPAKHVRAA